MVVEPIDHRKANMPLTPIKPARAVDLAADALRAEILAGVYGADQLLPPERTLSDQLGVNRQTLRGALARLQSEGLVEPQHGRGVVVLDFRRTGGIDLLLHLDDDRVLVDILPVRRAVAAEAVALACERATPVQLQCIDDLAARQQAEGDPEAFADGDLAFARAVVEASGSLPLLLLFNTVERLYRARPRLAARMLADTEAVRASYPAIAQLIRTADPNLARQLVTRALLDLDKRTLS